MDPVLLRTVCCQTARTAKCQISTTYARFLVVSDDRAGDSDVVSDSCANGIGACGRGLVAVASAIGAANAAAFAPTTTVVAAAADEVSAQIAALFAHHGQSYQAVSAQAAGSRTVP
ncbi:PE family protein [Mycobacterium pseudokansasii]|uniref:PE family protein n=1 Tax=Mycobacterium pseudokansasii TaxID=2341080 RepID=UPI00245345CF|nr:PE family protein [Mycobacterium pseudokansasii]